MFGRRRSEIRESPGSSDEPLPTSTPDSELATPKESPGERTLLDVAYPMQQVRVRWHTLDGGEVMVPGQVQSVNGDLVDVWFNRSAPSFSPMHADDQIWIDASSGAHTYVFAGWLIGMRPPDIMRILVKGLPRRDQRRQYVRERVELPPQILTPVDSNGDPAGPEQEVTVLDLSGGGARLWLSAPVPPNCSLELTLDVGTGPVDLGIMPIETVSTVSGRQVMRCYFTHIEERFRRDVIRFIFREQLRKARLAPPNS